MINLEKNVPLPEIGRGSNRIEKQTDRTKYPISEMEVGDSFFVPEKLAVNKTLGNYFTYRAKQIGIRVTTRTVNEQNMRGVRCWRIG